MGNLDSRVKQASLDYMPAPEGTWTEEAQATTEPAGELESVPATDPTLANAGLTELQDQSVVAQASSANGISAAGAPQHEPPSQTVITNGAANTVAQSAWDSQASNNAPGIADEWVEVNGPEQTSGNATPEQPG